MNNKIKEEIRTICTYHSDDGTSGYKLSEYEFNKIFALFERQAEELEIAHLKDLEIALKERREEIKEMVEKIPIDKAHTYSSENADDYRIFDNGQRNFKNKIITNLTTSKEREE